MSIGWSGARRRFPPLTDRATARAALLALAGLLACAMAGCRHGEDGEEDSPRARDAYYRAREAYPFQHVPAGARLSAFRHRLATWPQLASPVQALAPGVNTTTTWTALGPTLLNSGLGASTGRINSIALDPTDPLTLYIGAATGGVWKTSNGGASWTSLTDGQCSNAMGALRVDPKNPLIVYAATGEENFSGDSFFGCGVLRS
ncbi:MAG TPA: hypothetical protein VMH39_05585, partial [Gemmatimonadaceae bacterium]|nr:hypothetical protein [Gemmatimonadaceae bacterium]